MRMAERPRRDRALRPQRRRDRMRRQRLSARARPTPRCPAAPGEWGQPTGRRTPKASERAVTREAVDALSTAPGGGARLVAGTAGARGTRRTEKRQRATRLTT